MGKGIILRVLEGTHLSTELLTTLSKLLPGYKLEYFTEQPNYRLSFQRRIDSLYSAFLFILDAYPPNPEYTSINVETLKAYANECKAACKLDKNSVKDLHAELEQFTANIVNVLSALWKWPEEMALKEAIACLNEAEQYVLMSQGRLDTATLLPRQFNGATEYVLQLDESIPPHYDLLVKELQAIKDQGYPKTPLWFRKLTEYQQAYFCNLSAGFTDIKAVVEELSSFLKSWENIKLKALNLPSELKQIIKKAPPYPNWFNDLNIQLKEMVRVLAINPGEFDSNLRNFKDQLIQESTNQEYQTSVATITKLPEWYLVLSNRQQFFLEHVLKKATSIQEGISFISSRHRTLPAPANFGVHSLFRINNNGEAVLLHGKRWRSSHIASRDGLTWSTAVQQRHSDSNFSKVTERAKTGQKILMQTLISPIKAVDYISPAITSLFPELPPDLDLYKRARSTVLDSNHAKNTHQQNHPFNAARLIYYTETNDPDCMHLLATAKNYIKEKPGLQELLEDYEGVLKSPVGSATFWDYNGRELFLASLEELIILYMGGFSYGSCVSGKDRKAVGLIHSDAMMLYKEQYGSWPKFGDLKEKERGNFVSIVAELYCSRHQHELAGQNAPGSEGIKTPGWYFPKDIVDAINKRLGNEKSIEYDDRLATDNEVKYIMSKRLLSELPTSEKIVCKLIAKQLGEYNCTKLYDALSALINEKTRFQRTIKEKWTIGWFENKTENGPKGIEDIRAVMHDPQGGTDNTSRIEQILIKVLSRPVCDPSRTPATNSVYNRMRNLIKPGTCGLQVLVNNTVSEWDKLFQESKTVNSSIILVQ